MACHGATADPNEGRINPEPVPGQTAFESDDPTADAGTNGGASDTGTTGAASDSSAPAPGDKTGESPERAIEEADIIKVAGTRLYALSKIGGLSIIDVGTRDKLKFLGRWRANGEPFEMYVRDGVVLAMVNGFNEWSYEGGGYSSKQTSRVIALDVRDPAKIASIGDFAVPGEVSDSRIVGDVMYVVSHQNGYCWKCESGKPATVVMSLGIRDVRAISKVDQIAFTSPTASYSWWKRSVSATTSRFWIGGPEYSWSTGSKPRSTIQALDVSDPSGKLSLGASVTVDGLIQSRWQMDEVAGVLRVVSQPGGWSGLDPSVETFKISSSTVVTALGKTSLKLPKPEALMSVRFDGARGYAITAERTDPLFTIDLTDPANPKQMGELEMPGWVYHMEPRGNRLLGLGFDAANPEGGMTVSLFDVSNLATPKMIKRVNFGKGWASAPEDRDRIHKAFRVLDDQNLIMVPFSSQDWRSGGGYCHSAQSGIQLIDWKDDTLALRGVAGVYGNPRRAFLHDQRLFAVSDSQVATYDIANRDAPVGKASLPLANPSHKSAVVGDNLVQLSHDWWSQHAQLVIMPRANVDQAIPTGSLDLAPMIGDSTCGYYGWSSWWNASLYVKGTYAYVVVPSSYYYWDSKGPKESSTLVGVVDLRDPTKPVFVGKAAIASGASGYYYEGYYYGSYGNAVINAGQSTVFTGDAVVTMRTESSYDYVTGKSSPSLHHLSTLDLRDPKNPRAGGKITLPDHPMYTGLQLIGGKVYTSHYEPVAGGKVRFYMDEIDVSDPAAPKVRLSINVPGSLLSMDPQSGNAVTVDYRRTFHDATDHSECAKAAPPGDVPVFDWNSKTCVSIHRVLRLVKVEGSIAKMVQSLELPKSMFAAVTVADSRVLFRSGYSYYYGGYSEATPSDRAWVLDGVAAGSIAFSSEIALGTGYYYGGATWAHGDRAVTMSGGKLAVIDLANARVVRTAALNGYWTSHVAVANDNAYASLGDYGVTAIPLR